MTKKKSVKRWRPQMGEIFFEVVFCHSQMVVYKNYAPTEDLRPIYNYFKTRKAAQLAAKKIEKILRQEGK